MPCLSGCQPSKSFVSPLSALGFPLQCVFIASDHSWCLLCCFFCFVLLFVFFKRRGETVDYKAASTPVLILVCLHSKQIVVWLRIGEAAVILLMCQGCPFCCFQYHGSGVKFGDARKPMCIHF